MMRETRSAMPNRRRLSLTIKYRWKGLAFRCAPCLLLTTLLLVLSSCGPGAAAPTQLPAPPLRPRPIGAPAASPPPVVVAEGSALPGRLLFVVDGNLWLWQGQRGSPMTSSGDAYQPAWSPDGAQIAYVRREESASDLMRMAAAG